MTAHRRLLIALALFALSMPLVVSAQAAARRPALVDRIVAVVNKEVITLSELNDAIAAAERNLRRSAGRGEKRKDQENRANHQNT